MSLRVLSLDTTSPRLKLAYGPADGPAWKVFEEDVSSHGPGLLVRVQELLGPQGPDAVDALAVCRGPGSFTGIRIGLSFAKTFAAMRPVPLYLFDAFAPYFLLAPTPLWVLLDARRGELYASFKVAPDTPPSTPQVISLSTLPAPAGSRFAGTGALLYWEEISARFGDGCVLEVNPDAHALHETVRLVVQQETPVDPVAAEPLYLRASDAEVNLAAGRIRSAWNRVFSFDEPVEEP